MVIIHFLLLHITLIELKQQRMKYPMVMQKYVFLIRAYYPLTPRAPSPARGRGGAVTRAFAAGPLPLGEGNKG